MGGAYKATGWWVDAQYNSDTVDNRIVYFTGKTGDVGIWGGSLFMRDSAGTYQNICTASDGTVTTASSGNGARTTATTKKANPNGFEVGSPIWYSSTSYNKNANITGSNQIYASMGNVFDSRYAFNTTLSNGAAPLTAYKNVYLVGTVGSDGLFYLDANWWTQTPNNANKVYVLVGGVYDCTTSYVRMTLYEHNTWCKYVGGKLVDYSNNLAALAQSTADGKNAVFYSDTQPTATGRKVYDIWFDTAHDNTMYFWNGTAWTQKQFGTGAIGEQAITADLLAANSVTAEKIVGRAITAAKIATGTITANEIAANTITADKMSVTSLSAIAADLGSITAGSLNIGNGKFVVTNQGALTATGATITGKITATDGAIGGWTITDTQIHKSVITGGTEYRPILNAPASPSATTSAFAIATRTNDGAGNTGSWSYPFAVTYDGSLKATKGTIGGWTIGDANISTTNSSGNYVTLSNGTNTNQDILVVRTGAGTTASPYAWPFYIRADGTFAATKASITGAVTATSGKIAGFTIDGNSLKNGDYIDLSAYNASYSGARLQLGPGTGAHAALSSSQLVIYNASGVDSYITPTTIYSGGAITAAGAITAGSTINANYNGAMIRASNPTKGGVFCGVHSSDSGYIGVYTNGYWNGSALTGAGRWLIYRSTADTTCVPSELYTYNEGYTTLRPVISTNAGTNAVGVIQSNASSVGFYGRWAGGASASMSGRTISCPSSDIRLKKNIKDSEVDALSVINAIRMRQFDWKDPNRGHWDCGMVVDEMERDIDPKFRIGGEEDEEGNPSYKSVDTFFLQGYEVKAIQELHAEIKALKERIAELELKKGA